MIHALTRNEGRLRVNATRACRRPATAIAAVAIVFTTVTMLPARATTVDQWALSYLKADRAWRVSRGVGVTVAVVDTGVTPIPDLKPNLLSGGDFAMSTTSQGNGQTNTDPKEHGTSIASLIAGIGLHVKGLASQAKILPIRNMLEDRDGGGGAFAAAAIDFAVEHHVGVINISQGGPVPNPQEAAAIASAERADIVVVASTGNKSAPSVEYPAAYPGVLAVTAVDRRGALASFSDIGPQVSISAPGVATYVDNNLDRQVLVNGTSGAAAYVSATAALVRASHPNWTAGQVLRDLIGTADPGAGQTSGRVDEKYGFGIVDPVRALTVPAPTETTNPLPGVAAFQARATPTPTAAYSPPPAPSRQRISVARRIALAVALFGAPILVIVAVLALIFVGRRRNRRRPTKISGPQSPYQSGGPSPPRQPYEPLQSRYSPKPR